MANSSEFKGLEMKFAGSLMTNCGDRAEGAQVILVFFEIKTVTKTKLMNFIGLR